jgi:heavy metal sensor kinase
VLGPAEMASGDPRFEQWETGSGHFGVVTSPIMHEEAVIGVAQVGVIREEVDETLWAVSLIFAISAPLLLAASVAGGYWVSRRTLAPVVAITEMAANLQATDLGARLNLELPSDELGRLAQTFDAMLARIESAFERQRQFTGDAAHELRTPLSLMSGQIELTLGRDRTNDEYREAFHSVGADLERLTALVSTLLALSRADAASLPIERSLTDLGAIVANLLDAYLATAQLDGITLINDATSTIVPADEDLLVQLLVNLLDNAMTHTPVGGTITVGCEERGGRACLWVADTGPGIAAEHQERIFERFYRVQAGRDRARGGVGLGLAFCKAIADAHGGEITVASEPGQGARFEFCLPVAAAR